VVVSDRLFYATRNDIPVQMHPSRASKCCDLESSIVLFRTKIDSGYKKKLRVPKRDGKSFLQGKKLEFLELRDNENGEDHSQPYSTETHLD
jgi:hypothetical protein